MLLRFLRRGPQQAADALERGARQTFRAVLEGDLVAAERALVSDTHALQAEAFAGQGPGAAAEARSQRDMLVSQGHVLGAERSA